MTPTTRSSGHRFHENVHGVYFDDLDALQILHNSKYLLLVERTIGSFWAHLGPMGATGLPESVDRVHLVRANAIEYFRPVTGTGEVRVRVWIEKLGQTSLVFGFCVMPMDRDLDYACGTRVIVCVDSQTRVPTPWNEGLRKKLEPFVRAA
jgi:acyl-CoA thioester hydrolase